MKSLVPFIVIIIICLNSCSNASKTTQNPIISDIRISADVNSALIAWTTNESTNGKIEYGINEQYGLQVDSQNNLSTQHQVRLNNLPADTQHHFRIVVEDQDNNEVSSADQTFVTASIPLANNRPILNEPGNFRVNAGTELTITLSGSDPDPQDLQYAINNPPTGSSFSTNTFTWTPSVNQLGVYPLEFTISDGYYILPSISTVTVIDPAAQAPTEPGDLALVLSDRDKVQLQWIQSTDNTGIKHYRVYRNAEYYATVAETPSSSNFRVYEDVNVQADTLYTYEVTAVDLDDHESGRSNPVSVTTYDQNLIYFWDFDQGSGSIISSRVHNHWAADGIGKLIYDVNQPIPWTTGFNASAIQYPGVNNGTQAVYIDLNNLLIPMGEQHQLTIAAWIYLDEITQDARIISKANGIDEANHYWMLSTHQIDGGDLHLRFRLKTAGITSTLFGGSIPLVTWTHVSATYDGSAMAIYINGASAATPLAKTGPIDQGIGIPVRIGINPNDDRAIKGRIDEVRIYNSALNIGEIANLAN